MLVYGTRLWFTSDEELGRPLDVVTRWLSRKVGRQLTVGPFLGGVDRTFDGAHRIRCVSTIDQYPKVLGICYTHPDAQVWGRQWTTEIGFRRIGPDSDLECTVLLSTDEISSRVAAPVQVSRPGLVTELARRCKISPATQGTSVHTLDDEGGEAFRHVVLDPKRTYSIVVLSADKQDKYLADIHQLGSLVLGLADVVKILPGTDTFWLARVVGKDFVPYNGAVKLIYPAVRRLEGAPVPTRLITTEDATRLAAAGTLMDTEILSLIVHRSNLPLSRAHIGIQTARDLQIQRTLFQKRQEAAQSGDTAEYAKFLEELVTELELKIQSQAGSVQALEKLVGTQDDNERQLRYDVERLTLQLQQSGRSERLAPSAPERDAVIASVAATSHKGPSPEQALTIIEFFFLDRIVILDNAWESAHASLRFKHGRKLLDLLLTLATEYWSELALGSPDSEARKVFGTSYAAQESERVARNPEARARRTFSFRGEKYEMMKHLKIGTKDSASETIRVHFEWIPGDQLIVIGYCGEHIPFK